MAIKLTERDIEIFKIISKTGSISRGMLEEDFNMERRSIYRLTKGDDPYLKIHNTPTKKGKKIVNRYTYSFATKSCTSVKGLIHSFFIFLPPLIILLLNMH